jgi:hypothetical protein
VIFIPRFRRFLMYPGITIHPGFPLCFSFLCLIHCTVVRKKNSIYPNQKSHPVYGPEMFQPLIRSCTGISEQKNLVALDLLYGIDHRLQLPFFLLQCPGSLLGQFLRQGFTSPVLLSFGNQCKLRPCWDLNLGDPGTILGRV